MVVIKNMLKKEGERLPKGTCIWVPDFQAWVRTQVKTPVLFRNERYRLEEDGGAQNVPYFLREEEADEETGLGTVRLSLMHPELGECIRLDFGAEGELLGMTCWDCCLQFSLWDWRGYEMEPAGIRWLVETDTMDSLTEVRPETWLDLYYGRDCSSDPADRGVAWEA